MAKKRSNLRILLLQIRDAARVRQEELESFARYSNLGLNQIDVLNVFDQPKFDEDVFFKIERLSGFVKSFETKLNLFLS